MNPPIKDLCGWGRHPVVRGDERESEDLERASAGATLSRGLGRSYGDASLPARDGAPVLGTRRADRILSFEADTGVLRAEAGLSLRALNEIFPPRGWASPVSPGTQYVTLGGMVASDVHGKNHHVAGCFGEHVRALRLRVGDGRVLEIDDATEPDLFRATLGGMGLTGHILEVEVALERVPTPHSERGPWSARSRPPARTASPARSYRDRGSAAILDDGVGHRATAYARRLRDPCRLSAGPREPPAPHQGPHELLLLFRSANGHDEGYRSVAIGHRHRLPPPNARQRRAQLVLELAYADARPGHGASDANVAR